LSRFCVWAPYADKVDVRVSDEWTEMKKDEQGWWRVEVQSARPGDDYAFRINGGDARPDPRSPWQPEGVHGPSRLLDHGAFPWTDARWQSSPLSSAVIYEIHIGTFTEPGTFDSAISRLDNLVDLGVTHLELMPVNEFAGERGWGYDGVDIYAPHHAYGGPDGLKRLVDACHSRGLGVILDVVYNHFGPEGNYLAEFGPYFSQDHATPWGPAVNLIEPLCDEVRCFIIESALMWLRDYHVDGLRVDGVHALVDTSAVHLMEQLSAEVETLSAREGRHLFVIGESDLNDPRLILPREIGGYGVDAQWSGDFHHALHVLLTGEREGYYVDYSGVADLAKAFEHSFVYDDRFSVFRQRRFGRRPIGVSGHQFVAFLQNHDQVGNRALGERIAHIAGERRQMVGAGLLFASPFVPLLFQGEEWAASTPFRYFTSYESQETGRRVREGRRREFESFGWDPVTVPDPQSQETFRASKLPWSELSEEPHRSMRNWYRDLIRLRRNSNDLSDGRMEDTRTQFAEGRPWLLVERGEISVIANLGDEQETIALPEERPRRVLLASDTDVVVREDGVDMPPVSIVFLGP
jgi:maltooligosyltrehalose trehalohydrolase